MTLLNLRDWGTTETVLIDCERDALEEALEELADEYDELADAEETDESMADFILKKLTERGFRYLPFDQIEWYCQ